MKAVDQLYTHSDGMSLKELKSVDVQLAEPPFIHNTTKNVSSNPRQNLHYSSKIIASSDCILWSSTRPLFSGVSSNKSMASSDDNSVVNTTKPINSGLAPQTNIINGRQSLSMFCCALPDCKWKATFRQEIALRYNLLRVLHKRNPGSVLSGRIESTECGIATESDVASCGTESGSRAQDGRLSEGSKQSLSGESVSIDETPGRMLNKFNTYLPTPISPSISPEPNDIGRDCQRSSSPYLPSEDFEPRHTPSTFRHGLPSPSSEPYVSTARIGDKFDEEHGEDEINEEDNVYPVELSHDLELDNAWKATTPSSDNDVPPLSPVESYHHDPFIFSPVEDIAPADEVLIVIGRESEEVEEVVSPFPAGMQFEEGEQGSSLTTEAKSNFSPPTAENGENRPNFHSSSLEGNSPEVEHSKIIKSVSLHALSLGEVENDDLPLSPHFPVAPSAPSLSSLIPSAPPPHARNCITPHAGSTKSGRGKKHKLLDGTKDDRSVKRPRILPTNKNGENHNHSSKGARPHVNHNPITNNTVASALISPLSSSKPIFSSSLILKPDPKAKPPSSSKIPVCDQPSVKPRRRAVPHSAILETRNLTPEQDHRRRQDLVPLYKNPDRICEIQLAEWDGELGRILYKHAEMGGERADRDKVVRILEDILAVKGLFTKTYRGFKSGKIQSQNALKLLEKLAGFREALDFGDGVRNKCAHILAPIGV